MQLLSIVALAAVFVGASLLSVNMGLVGLAAAFVVGSLVGGLPVKDVLAGFPADLFVTLVGVTYLFAVASRNGTVDRIVGWATRVTGDHPAAMPWLMFGLAAVITGIGALSPAAVAVLAPVALRFGARHGLSPLMMGLMVIHGAQAGGFSPMSVYGGITNQVVARAGLVAEPGTLFLAAFAFNAAIALVVFVALGGLAALRRPVAPADAPSPVAATAHEEATGAHRGREQAWTLVAVSTLAVASLGFGLNVGLTALVVLVLLAVVAPGSHGDAEQRVGWGTVLLICGIITYVGVMERLGTVTWLGDAVAEIGRPMLAALALCYMAGIVSAFASSTALLGILVPLAVPFLMQGHVGVTGMVAAIAVATTIVDTSPFSTNGALVVAQSAPERRPVLLRQLLAYSAIVVALGPLLAWAVLVD